MESSGYARSSRERLNFPGVQIDLLSMSAGKKRQRGLAEIWFGTTSTKRKASSRGQPQYADRVRPYEFPEDDVAGNSDETSTAADTETIPHQSDVTASARAIFLNSQQRFSHSVVVEIEGCRAQSLLISMPTQN